MDTRDRMTTELAALSLMTGNNFHNIPKVLRADQASGIVTFEYINGFPVTEVKKEDIDTAVRFLGQLKKISKQVDFAFDASEAFFTVNEVLLNIKNRLARFNTLASSPVTRAVKDFLNDNFTPRLNHLERQCRQILASHDIAADNALPREDKTLSPSDFGFHNAIRRPNGEICFLDFEYFGWDDPAKTLCDFILHPAMQLDDAICKRYTQKFLTVFDSSKNFTYRATALFPLFGLKWCLILLNEFLEADSRRRTFALDKAKRDSSQILSAQLSKAKHMFLELEKKYEKFSSYLA